MLNSITYYHSFQTCEKETNKEGGDGVDRESEIQKEDELIGKWYGYPICFNQKDLERYLLICCQVCFTLSLL